MNRALNAETLRHAFSHDLFYVQGKIPTLADRCTTPTSPSPSPLHDQMLDRSISTASR